MRALAFLLLIMALAASSCRHPGSEEKKPEVDMRKIKKAVEKIHQQNVEIEDRQIDDYLQRRGWHFQKTATGLRYDIIRKGNGLKPQPGDKVWLEYKTSLIRGEKVYDSKTDGIKTFYVDKDNEISGLHQFIKMINVGTKAMVIIPSYLAYGATGDDNKIPPRATLIMEVELKRLERR